MAPQGTFSRGSSLTHIKGNPLYVRPGNYVLGATSPAHGKGERNSYSPTLDLNGIVRPNPPSIGGYEP